MFEVGLVCMKLAGRDAGQKCVVVKILEGKYVLIDGMTRRKKCNVLHLEPTGERLEISENASHDEVTKAFKGLGHEAKAITKPKAKMTKLAATRHQLTKAAAKTPAEKKAKKEKAEKPKAKKKEAKKE